MSENRKCVNCRHRIIGENCSSKCEIDGHRIDYAECFDGWCRHWAKKKDGKEAKFVFVDDLHDTKVADFSKLNGIGKQWYEHCLGNNCMEVKMGAVYCAKELEEIERKES